MSVFFARRPRSARSIAPALLVLVLGGAGLAPPAFADSAVIHAVPLDGAHWQAGAGLPDSTGNSQSGLVQNVTAAGHTEVPMIKGLSGTSASSLTGLSFAASVPSGIIPCWKVYLSAADGSVSVLHLTLDSARNEGSQPPPIGDFAPFTRWSWSFTIPARLTIDRISLQVDAGQTPPPTGDRVSFDGIGVNGTVIAHP